MKKFFSSIFNAHPQVKNISKDKEEDDLIDRLEMKRIYQMNLDFNTKMKSVNYEPLLMRK